MIGLLRLRQVFCQSVLKQPLNRINIARKVRNSSDGYLEVKNKYCQRCYTVQI
jgi:hypothetical protein